MNITDTTSVLAQDFAPAPGAGNPHYAYVFSVCARVLTSATGTLNIVVRWTDPELGALSRTLGMLLSPLNNYASLVLNACVSGDTNPTVECNLMGIIGSPQFSVDAHCQFMQG